MTSSQKRERQRERDSEGLGRGRRGEQVLTLDNVRNGPNNRADRYVPDIESIDDAEAGT